MAVRIDRDRKGPARSQFKPSHPEGRKKYRSGRMQRRVNARLGSSRRKTEPDKSLLGAHGLKPPGTRGGRPPTGAPGSGSAATACWVASSRASGKGGDGGVYTGGCSR